MLSGAAGELHEQASAMMHVQANARLHAGKNVLDFIAYLVLFGLRACALPKLLNILGNQSVV